MNIKVKKYQKALNDFSLISKGYTNLKIFEFKGDCYSKLKNQKNAINQYSLYLEKLPEDSNVINKRGESFLLLGNITSANLDFKRAANIKWVSKGFLYKYGWYVLFIIGFFTITEYKEYIQNSSNINKRMMNLVIERLKSQVQIIEIQ